LILDFESRLRAVTLTANEPFLFHTSAGAENFTGVMTWSLKGLAAALRTVGTKTIEFHNVRGDFQSWAEHSLQDEALSQQFGRIGLSKLEGENLREALVKVAETRFRTSSKQVQKATRLL
jgi:hypothetical protein